MFLIFILGILVNALHAVALGSLIAGCLWVCAHLWKDIMS